MAGGPGDGRGSDPDGEGVGQRRGGHPAEEGPHGGHPDLDRHRETPPGEGLGALHCVFNEPVLSLTSNPSGEWGTATWGATPSFWPAPGLPFPRRPPCVNNGSMEGGGSPA